MTPLAAVASAWSASLSSISASEGVAGIGIDMVELVAFAELHATGGQAFLDNGWTGAEQRAAQGSVERLAARWAAKEAVMKALGRGLGDLDPLDIEIVSDAGGAPGVTLRGNAVVAAAMRAVDEWHVSLCHEDGWAAAIAVAQRRRSKREWTHEEARNHHA